MSAERLHIIYVSEDGVAALTCGVGTIAQNFVAGFADLARSLKPRYTGGIRLSVVSLRLEAGTVGLRDDLLRDTEARCHEFGGAVHLIDAAHSASANYFNLSAWRYYNEQAREVIERITDVAERTIVIANDVIFGQTFGTGVRTINVWIPHSLVCVHQQSYSSIEDRDAWEQAIVDRIRCDGQSCVGTISPYVHDLLKDATRLPDKKLVAFNNGFYLPQQREWRRTTAQLKAILEERGIPTDKTLVFCFGRADEYKGLDVSLTAMQQFMSGRSDCHAVLVASRFSGEAFIGRLQEELARLADGAANVSLFFDYEFDLPKYLLQWPKTLALLHLPRRDFAPLIPAEAALIGHRQLVVVNSDIPCLRQEFLRGYACLMASLDAESASVLLQRLAAMAIDERRTMVRTAQRFSRQAYNIVSNYGAGIIDASRHFC